MKYKNDATKAIAWLRSHGAIATEPSGNPNSEKLSQIAKLCMDVYKPQPGDVPLVGWFVFDGVYNEDGTSHKSHDADGFCFILDGKAVIGLSLYTIQQSFEYAVVVGLHEVTHLRYEKHDDDFVSFNSTLAHDLLKKNRKRQIAHAFRLS